MSRFKRFGLALIAASLGSIGAQADTFIQTDTVGPQGTQAGTPISNQARAEFQINGNPVEELSNVETFEVDERIQVDVTVQAATVQVQPDDDNRIQPFLITNLGNGQEQFSLTAVPNITTGDDFNPIFAENQLVYRAAGGTCTPGDIQASQQFDTGNDELNLASGGTILICVPADIPDTVSDGEEGFLDLVAQSLTAGASVAGAGDVLDAGGDGGVDAVVVQAQGSDTDRGVYVVSAVEVTVIKSIISVNENPDDATSRDGAPGTPGGGRFIPGALVTYRLDVTVSGSGEATNLLIIDEIRDDGEEIQFVANSTIVNGIGRDDNEPPVSVTDVMVGGVPHKRITVDFGNASPTPTTDVDHFFTFQVEVQ